MRKIFTFFALAAMTLSMSAQKYADAASGLYFEVTGSNTAKIVYDASYADKDEVNIPATVKQGSNTYTVNEIGDQAFKNCTGLMVVESSDERLTIGEEAFMGCTSLEICIINNCIEIKKKAFLGCTIIDGDGINKVEVVGDSTFVGCTNFAIRWFTANNNKTLTSIGAYAFEGTKFGASGSGIIFLGYNGSTLHIGEHAFKDCANAQDIRCWLSTLTYDGDESPFDDIKEQVESVLLSTDLVSVPAKLFAGMANATFKTVDNVPLNNLTTIGDSAFAGCTKLDNATLSRIFGSKLAIIGADAFKGCSGITAMTLPASLTTIGDRAFAGLSSLAQITANMTTPPAINANVFNDCGNLGMIKLKVDDANYDTYKAANVWKNFKLLRQSGLWTISFNGHDIDKATIQVLNAANDEVLDEEQIADGTTVKFIVTPEAGYHVRETPAQMQITEDKYITIDIYSLTYRQRFIAAKMKDSDNNYIEVGTIQYKKNGEDFVTEGYTYYEYGTILQVTAIPKEGYAFSHWEDNSTNPTRSFSYTFNFTDGKYSDYTYFYECVDRTAIFEVDPATGVDNTAAERKAVKRMVNGQLLIERDGKTYNALGAEMK